MGQEKAFVLFHGQTLLERALAAAHVLSSDVVILGDRDRFQSFGKVVEDTFRGRGPLGGIHAALSATQGDLNLILAVDMPFINADFMAYLCRRAQANDAIVTIPKLTDGWQPLCAIYRKGFAISAEKSLSEGKNKIDRLFETVSVDSITEGEIVAAGFSREIFGNVNTPEDLKTARQVRN